MQMMRMDAPPWTLLDYIAMKTLSIYWRVTGRTIFRPLSRRGCSQLTCYIALFLGGCLPLEQSFSCSTSVSIQRGSGFVQVQSVEGALDLQNTLYVISNAFGASVLTIFPAMKGPLLLEPNPGRKYFLELSSRQ